MYGYIYITFNLKNNMKYIGKRVEGKFNPKYLGSGIYLTRAINKHGKENFKPYLLYKAFSREELEFLEKETIKHFNAVESKEFYNINSGGSGFGCGKSNHMTKQKYKDMYSIKFSGSNNPMYKSGERGIHPKGMLGKHHTEETKRRISKNISSSKNPFWRKNWNDYGGHPRGMLGKHHTNTQWKTQLSVEVILTDGSVYRFSNLSKASRELNIPRNVLDNSLKKQKPYKNPNNFKDYKVYNGIVVRQIDNTEVTYDSKAS